MFDFHFIYLSSNTFNVSNITKITIQTGDEILSTNIPLQTMYLHGDNGNYTILGDDLTAIKITKLES